MTFYQKVVSSILLIAAAAAIVAYVIRSVTGAGQDEDSKGEPMEK